MPTSHSTFAPVEASPPSRLDLPGGATVVVPGVLPGVAVVPGVLPGVAMVPGVGGVVVSVAGGRVWVVVDGGRDGSGLVTTTFS